MSPVPGFGVPSLNMFHPSEWWCHKCDNGWCNHPNKPCHNTPCMCPGV
jgi:hypothetical protein